MDLSFPSTDRRLQELQRYIRRHEMLHGGERVLVAVSGGIDSTVLFHMMLKLSEQMRLKLGIVHFDHGLRDSSKDDAAFVLELAKEHRLKAYIGKGDVRKMAEEKSQSLEEAARKARYNFIERIAKRHRFTVVLTAHNADDNTETFLINMLRGSGITGLSGIPPVRMLAKGVLLARPLLGVERKEIERYAKLNEIEWREDETNKSPDFTRNRVRHELVPMLREFNPNIINTLNATTAIMRSFDNFIGHSVDHAVQQIVKSSSDERVELHLNQLKHYVPAIQGEVLQRVVSETFELPPISFDAVERVLGLLWKETGTIIELGNNLGVLRDRDLLIIRRDPPPLKRIERKFQPGETVQADSIRLETEVLKKGKEKFVRDRMIEFVDSGKLSGKLTLRTWRDGDRFMPIGMQGEKKVSDFLIDQKVSRDEKRSVCVLVDGDKIIWVCGMRIDDRYKVTSDTKEVLRLELKHGNNGSA